MTGTAVGAQALAVSAPSVQSAAGRQQVDEIRVHLGHLARVAPGDVGSVSYLPPNRLVRMDERLPVASRLVHLEPVIVENPDSADCQVKLDMAVSSRSWAKQQTSNFTFRSDVVVQGRHTTNNAVKTTSCLDQDTPILLVSSVPR